MYRFGVDIGGTNIAFGIIDDEYRIIYKSSVRFPHSSPEGVAGLINELYHASCKNSNIPCSQFECIGLCVPGSIDKHGETVINAYNLDFHQVPLKRMVEEQTGIHVQLANDADAATLAEHRFGALKAKTNAILVTIGTGIGGGIILNGKLFHGGKGNGIELGHMVMDIHGEKCTCGRNGCVETLCSASYLNKRAKELCWQCRGAMGNYSVDSVDGKALIHEAMNGDNACIAVWTEYVNNLSEAFASYINLYDPECIAIGGGISGAGEFLIKPLSRLTAQKCFFKDNPPEILCAKLGNDAGILGSVI